MLNVLNTRPGLLDRATLGTPGRYSFCFAEDAADGPWEPLHARRGFAPEAGAVTLYASNSLMGIYNQLAGSPEPLLLQLAPSVLRHMVTFWLRVTASLRARLRNVMKSPAWVEARFERIKG